MPPASGRLNSAAEPSRGFDITNLSPLSLAQELGTLPSSPPRFALYALFLYLLILFQQYNSYSNRL